MLEDALKILKKLEDNGYKAYIVGGYPRDILLGIETIDVDICTSATPKEIKEVLGDVVLPKEQYGSVRVVTKNGRYEITTFRKDLDYIDNRRPNKIEYVDNLIDDLNRRDITINTICMDKDEQIIDLLNAKEDLKNKTIKMVGDPDIRLEEDALRILRCIRFSTTLNFEIEKSLKMSIAKKAYLLKNLSYNRKKEELEKIFSSKYASRGIELIKELGIDKHLELNFEGFVLTHSLLGIWSQLDVLNIYPFTINEKDIINKVNEVQNKNLFDNKVLYKYGLYICTIAGEIKKYNYKDLVDRFNQLPFNCLNDLKITYNEICAITNKIPSKEVKLIFEDIQNKVLDNCLNNNHDELVNYVLEINNI